MSAFDPNSNDAVFSRILTRLDAQDEVLAKILEGQSRYENRTDSLERWRSELKGRTATIAVVAGAAISVLSEIAREAFTTHK